MPSYGADDEVRWRRTDRVRLRKWRLSEGDDLENALHAAERLLAEAEERRRHEQNRTFAIVSIMVGVVLSLTASLIAIRYVFAFVPVVASVLILALLVRALIVQRRRVALDYTLRLACQLASMIGESYLDVADREAWSYLRREATKLRLAAFPMYDSLRGKVKDH